MIQTTQTRRRRLGASALPVILSIMMMGAAEPDNPKHAEHAPGEPPKVGSDAPNFKLKRNKDESKEVELASFKGKKPVVLIFGSYT